MSFQTPTSNLRERKRAVSTDSSSLPDSDSDSETPLTKKLTQTIPEKKSTPPSASSRAKEEDSQITLLDALRGVVLLLLVSSALSYFITRESFLWNMQRPRWTRLDVVKGYFTPAQEYTDESLRLYGGQNPSLPLLLAINGSIYDVSAGRRHYGPGGSYHFFAGADASRGFVTSCFKEDRNPDMRGVELMYIPLDNPEVDVLYSEEEMRVQKAKEIEDAKRQVHAALKHWVDFFEKGGKYPYVGRVKREKGWETKGPVKALCREARESRPKRRAPPPGKTIRPKATEGA